MSAIMRIDDMGEMIMRCKCFILTIYILNRHTIQMLYLFTFKCDIVFLITTLFYNLTCFGLILAGHHQRFLSITNIYTFYTVLKLKCH
jgi:hypothetical protein